MIDWKAIQTLALTSILESDDSYIYRKVCRLYSKTYNTPLPQVHKLPPLEVLREVFEGIFEDMDESDFYSTVRSVITTEDDAANEERLIQEQIARWEAEELAKKKPSKQNSPKKELFQPQESFIKFDMQDEEKDYTDELSKEGS